VPGFTGPVPATGGDSEAREGTSRVAQKLERVPAAAVDRLLPPGHRTHNGHEGSEKIQKRSARVTGRASGLEVRGERVTGIEPALSAWEIDSSEHG